MLNTRKLHLAVGILTVVIFLITGQIMSHHQPSLKSLGDAERLMYRSRHLYILASGLVNLMLGLYLQTWNGWRGSVQRIGSVLLFGSPVLLILAFRHDPGADLRSHLWWSTLGLFALFGGCMLHLIGALGQDGASPTSDR